MSGVDWNLNNKDIPCLIILLLISLISTEKMLCIYLPGSISCPDIAVYLLSGFKYAGLDFYNVVYPEELFYTPVISFISSIFFKIGFVNKNAIIFVTTFINLLGFYGLYILFRNRFNSLLSLTGVIIYGSFPILLLNFARGMIDLPSVSISIWVLVFAILSIEKNPKYFLITFPLLIVGFFTKYIAGFTLPLIILYYAMNKNLIDKLDLFLDDKKIFNQKLKIYIKSTEFKYILISIILSLFLFIIICKYLILDFGGSLTFIQQSADTFNGHVTSNAALDFNMDKSYYFDHFHNILFSARQHSSFFMGLLYSIFVFGLLLNTLKFIKNFNQIKSKKRLFRTKKLDKILLIIGVLLIFINIFIFKEIPNHMIINIFWCISILIFYSVLEKFCSNTKSLSMDLLFLAYLFIYFTFISLYAIKVPRYAFPIIPPFVYFIIWGLNSLICAFDNKKIFNLKFKNIIPVFVIIIFVLLTFSVIDSPMDFDDSKKSYRDIFPHDLDNDFIEVCDFISNNDVNYHNKSFASYYHHSRFIRWYLNVNLTILDDNANLKNFYQTDYVILNHEKELDNYELIYQKGRFNVYYLNK